jgi:hypothetical protein
MKPVLPPAKGRFRGQFLRGSWKARASRRGAASEGSNAARRDFVSAEAGRGALVRVGGHDRIAKSPKLMIVLVPAWNQTVHPASATPWTQSFD